MKQLLPCLSLIWSAYTSAGSPSSIVGEWQFDSVRTITEHIEGMTRPDGIEPEAYATQLAEVKAGLLAHAPVVDVQTGLSVSEDTLVFRSANDERRFTYREVGGNSSVVVLDAVTDTGKQWVLKIRLASSGIALEQTDCETFPQQCIEEQVSARSAMAGESEQPYSVVGGSSAAIHDRSKSPKLVYFKSVRDNSHEP